MALSDLLGKANRLVSDNSTTILTTMGVTGTITTAYLTGRASFRAAELIHSEEWGKWDTPDESEHTPLSNKEKAKLIWPLYIPAAGVGTSTIISIVMANKSASKQVAALAMASSLSDRALQEYKAKVIEKIGETKERAVRDELAQDRVNAHPVNTREIILAGTGEVLCFDQLTGRYFQSTVEEIKKAENKVNHDILHHMYASLSSFYDEIGLPPTPYSDTVGWNSDALLNVHLSTVMSTDSRPCIAIDFELQPFSDYDRLKY